MDIEKLIPTWIALHEVEENSPNYKRNFWAFEKLDDICENDPKLCWEIILEILNRDISDTVFGNLAAGPTEDLLVRHGPDFIDKFEKEAGQNERFKNLLSGVWQNDIVDDIWKRVLAVSGERW